MAAEKQSKPAADKKPARARKPRAARSEPGAVPVLSADNKQVSEVSLSPAVF
jgi:hypothetical protein